MTNKTQHNNDMELSTLPNLEAFCLSLFERFTERENFAINIDRREENSIVFSYTDIASGKDIKVKFQICEEHIADN